MKLQKSISHYMRAFHRDIGFFVIGLTIIISLSGIIQIYRQTDFLKKDTLVERKLPANTDENNLGMLLRMKKFKVQKIEGDNVYFNNGTYNKATGIAKYSVKVLPIVLEKFNVFHKATHNQSFHWFLLVYGILLLFLAVSSFWMFKTGTKLFRRGIYISGAGIVLTIFILFIT